ncbi:MAG: hypothetical protein ACI86H_002835 [bacterium]|jgi:uncharacterized protein (TIGR01777 family)
MSQGKIIIAGGSGFLGNTLSKWFSEKDYQVIILSRKPDSNRFARTVLWDGKTLDSWSTELEGATALINMAGRSVNCRYNEENRREMMDSRLFSTRVLGDAIQQCKTPPKVWLNSSTATIYKHTYDNAHDETGITGSTLEAKDDFSVEIAKAWEKEFESIDVSNTRKLILRTAMVFGKETGGVYEELVQLVKRRLGGKMGDGRQYVSWIHANDFCHSIEWLINKKDATGIYNISAPNPLSNKAMMEQFRHECNVSFGLPATKWMLEVGAFFMRTETELIIKSRRVVPARLIKEGFSFQFSKFSEVLTDLK